eukprot:Em0023g9a
MDGLIDPKIDQESVSIEAKTVSNDASLCNKLRHHLKPKKRPLIDIPVGAKRKRYVGIDEYECESKGCCWEATSGQPYCFEQSDSGSSFVVSSVASTTLGVKLTLTSNESTEYGQNISPLVVEFSSETNDRLHVKVYDPNNARWEVPANVSPIPIPPSVTPTSPQFTYQYAQVGQPFFFTVIRNSTSEVLFSTAGTSLQFADQYLELSTTLPTNYNIYGLGEHVRPLRISPGSSLTLWNLDIPDPVNINLYGSHPFYLDLRPSGDAHGVFLRNCNGMDVTTDTNLLTYKIIGGILDFYFMLGPEPEAVVQQYHEIIGRPHMPPYWSLGWHQCRYGYPNIQAVEEVVSNYSTNKIPLDTMWTDIDYMDAYKDFTLDPVNYPASQVQSFVSDLHSKGMRYVVIVDPGIATETGYEPYDDGVQQGIFIKDQNGNIFVGKVWPGLCAFPDFLNPATTPYWQTQIAKFRSNLVDVDGLWIDMNEASNFCNGACSDATDDEDTPPCSPADPPVADDPPENHAGANGLPPGPSEGTDTRCTQFSPNNPPYAINNSGGRAALNAKTLDMTAVHYQGVLEYNCKNLYGHTEAIATHTALENIIGKRSFVLSRSTWPGSGAYTAHWTGDNSASYDDLYYSIPGILNFQLFGIPHVGADICGFNGGTTEELCSRWTQLGAFYPFARNHNAKGQAPQEPYVWSSVAAIARDVLAIRYSILPYYYTLFYKAHRPISPGNVPAATVVRPLFFEFPTDPKTYDIDQQFLVGSGLLISPVLQQGATSVSAYFPAGKWYDWYSHEVVSSAGGETKELPTPIDHIQIQVRGGTVIPLQSPALTTAASRSNSFSLLVALDTAGNATGDLYLDDGESLSMTPYTFIEYQATNSNLTATVTDTGYAANCPPLTSVTIIGVDGTPSQAELNGAAIDFKFNSATSELVLPSLDVKMSSQFVITWE